MHAHLQEEFFSNEANEMHFSEISSSVAFAFYIRDLEELNNFYSCLRNIENDHPEDFFLYLDLNGIK